MTPGRRTTPYAPSGPRPNSTPSSNSSPRPSGCPAEAGPPARRPSGPARQSAGVSEPPFATRPSCTPSSDVTSNTPSGPARGAPTGPRPQLGGKSTRGSGLRSEASSRQNAPPTSPPGAGDRLPPRGRTSRPSGDGRPHSGLTAGGHDDDDDDAEPSKLRAPCGDLGRRHTGGARARLAGHRSRGVDGAAAAR